MAWSQSDSHTFRCSGQILQNFPRSRHQNNTVNYTNWHDYLAPSIAPRYCRLLNYWRCPASLPRSNFNLFLCSPTLPWTPFPLRGAGLKLWYSIRDDAKFCTPSGLRTSLVAKYYTIYFYLKAKFLITATLQWLFRHVHGAGKTICTCDMPQFYDHHRPHRIGAHTAEAINTETRHCRWQQCTELVTIRKWSDCDYGHTIGQQVGLTDDRGQEDRLTWAVAGVRVVFDASHRLHGSTFHSSFSRRRAHDAADHLTCTRTERVPHAGSRRQPVDDDEGQTSTLTTHTDTQIEIQIEVSTVQTVRKGES